MKFAKLALVALTAFILQGCIMVPPLFGERRGPLEVETLVPSERYFSSDQILVIDLTGAVDVETGGGLFRPSKPGMLVQLKDRLKFAKQDRYLKGVILRINSPGGSVTASDLIYHEIKTFKEERPDVPVIAFMQDIAASGGLYVAMAADDIYALPTTVTGSIGVITFLPDLRGLSDKVGFGMRVIKSGENKDIGSPWSEMSDEQREIFQGMIDSMYEKFLAVILEGRGEKGLTREQLMTFADGRILTADRAAELGIIDGVAYPDEVFELARKAAESDDAAIVSYEYPYSNRQGNFYATSNAANANSGLPEQINLLNVDLGLDRFSGFETRFQYLWLP